MFTTRLKQVINYIIATAIGFYSSFVFAEQGATQGATNIAGIASTITQSFNSIGALMMATAYLAGFGLTIAAIFKFKQHKDNPTQIPMGTPLALLVIGIALIFLPSFIGPAGQSVFGTTSGAGGFTGGGIKVIPGAVGT